MRTGTVVGRRRLLLAAAALPLAAGSLAACTGDGGDAASTSPSPGAPDDPDLALRRQVWADEAALLAAYDATLDAHPDLADRLAPLRAQHLAHRDATGVSGPSGANGGAAASGGSSAGGGTATGGGSDAAVPSSRRAAVAALAALERKAAGARTDACGRAASGELARVLALVSASEASHAAALSGSGAA